MRGASQVNFPLCGIGCFAVSRVGGLHRSTGPVEPDGFNMTMRNDPDLIRTDLFVRRHFGFRGSLRLHRAALGWDLLAAPVNVVLAPVFLLSRLIALAFRAIGLGGASRWLLDRPIFIHSSLARAVEALVEAELWQSEEPLNDRQHGLLRDYTAVRTSVSEIFTTLVVLSLGIFVFRHATPGIVSLAPLVSDYVSHSAAVANFPLGRGLGQAWYAAFPPAIPVWKVLAVGVGLAVVASLVTTFAGILADPIQARLGIHRRRLLRLQYALAASDDSAPSLAREHALARLADITDAGVSLFRFLRG
ncbi:hypothetical protein SAMN05421757_104416 [Tropicimonas sediminicola]|uniref:Uncharacterized protein n=2 Tax=Tropicimonas sediminicola TaxID=1031541 RepID=A0A239IJ81_9RHOB|nr:hypothetical protein SAMN05421757_104416 [Tropicimonas sediminicola]